MKKTLDAFEKDIADYATKKSLQVLHCYENGNHFTGILSDGTRIRETIESEDNRFLFSFAENADVKITNHCTAGCKFCHENSSPNGKHADLNLPIFDTWKAGTEVAIGGGNVLDHPDLIPFLQKLKKQGAICNITVNQIAVYEQKDLLLDLLNNNLLNGIGISITNPSAKDQILAAEDICRLTDNVVYHVIAGIVDKSFLPILANRKVLFLGYKSNVGRGVTFNNDHKDKIEENIIWLAKNLKTISRFAKVLSFDNLALAQLDARKNLGLSDQEWDLRFQGKDYGDPDGMYAPSTFYFDAVNQEIARSSTQPYNERIKYTGQTFVEAFEASLTNYTVNEDQYGELR